jgi:CoA-dependent NAD(P)H sulfur oxidoreductase
VRASRARRLYPDLEIIVLEQSFDVSYSACSMPYNIADPDTPMDTLVVRTAKEFIDRHGIDLRTGHRVTGIDRDARQVSGTTVDGKPFFVDYDKLLIATGAVPALPDLPGKDRLMPLKSLEHGRRIKEAIRKNRVKTAVILGMGYIALEMCEALTELGIQVALVKPGARFLPWLPQELAQIVEDTLIKNRTAFYPGTDIVRIEPKNGGSAVICDTRTLDADLVLGATGIAPCSGWQKMRAWPWVCQMPSTWTRTCTPRIRIFLRPATAGMPFMWSQTNRSGFLWPCGPTVPDGLWRTTCLQKKIRSRVWQVPPCSRCLIWLWPGPD